MTINNLHVYNFKVLIDNEFKLSRFNVFIGPNGSGKSSVLQALAMAKYASLGYHKDPKSIPYPAPESPIDLRNILNRDRPFIIRLSGAFYYRDKDLGNIAIESFIEVSDYNVREQKILRISVDSKTILAEGDIPGEGFKAIEVKGKTIEVSRAEIRVSIDNGNIFYIHPCF